MQPVRRSGARQRRRRQGVLLDELRSDLSDVLAAITFGVRIATAAVAAAQTPVRIRGSIEEQAGSTLKVKSRESPAVEIKLAADHGVAPDLAGVRIEHVRLS